MKLSGAVTRGNLVSWQTEFFDANNEVITADAAWVRVTRGAFGTPEVIQMERGDDGWVAEWNTSNSAPGLINWHAWCETPTPSAQDGFFIIEANPANLGT